MPTEPRDLFPPADEHVTAVHALIAKTLTTPSDDCFVTVDAFDGGQQMWGPCALVPGGALPSAGDDCLLVLA